MSPKSSPKHPSAAALSRPTPPSLFPAAPVYIAGSDPYSVTVDRSVAVVVLSKASVVLGVVVGGLKLNIAVSVAEATKGSISSITSLCADIDGVNRSMTNMVVGIIMVTAIETLL